MQLINYLLTHNLITMKKITLLITVCLLATTIGFAQTATTSPKPASSIEIASVPDQMFTGAAITPEPVIKFGAITLKKDTDYTLAYSNNTNVGTATITITGKGNYSDTKTVNFKIVPMSFGGKGSGAAVPKSTTGTTTPAN